MDKLSIKVNALVRGTSHTEDVGIRNVNCINDFVSYGQEFSNEQVDFVGNYNQRPVDNPFSATSSVSLMPLSICEKLKVRELKPTTIYLQLADLFIKYPVGILENVTLNNGVLTLRVRDEEVEFNLNQVVKKHHEVDSCLRIDVIDEIVEEEFKKRLKEALTTTPTMQPLDWSLPFEVMCDTSDFAVEAILGQKKEKRSYAIYCASKTLDNSQEFDLEIKDKKGAKNVAVDHLSRIKHKSKDGIEEELPIDEFFSNEQLLVIIDALPWFADFVNYLSCGVLPLDLSYQ
ncbi:uncharacterized protein LOC131172135 [Hevea brasiliensis]|uniref:uncharacterized protein LOC131172135 n=1 Tax=Hevea brasiliensis TaxID=3981 RepID=UPI0025CC9E58|nr:uncharacterized protein LOC131172135 [Hevea brasiliensis]